MFIGKTIKFIVSRQPRPLTNQYSPLLLALTNGEC